ncbi:phosphate acyltransferase PlsX [Atopobacter phocae]|uniref:phosphate acyltransferase PlsX n=1 Tax=Atopobacter phocae TaxID=136492 RepID=UPI000470957D|nr:phosphate acyltransferase PlsX [Atopobacter phocae]
MRIAIDAMGGDFAPQSVVEAVNHIAPKYPQVTFQLFGPQDQLSELIKERDNIKIFHAPDKISGDAEPVRAVRRQKTSSLVLAAQSVKEGQSDALVSAGNTGALLTAGLLIVGRIKGIDRPALAAVLPAFGDTRSSFVLLDVGANADTKLKNMQQFAFLGSLYAKYFLHIEQPTVGLINNGSEETKGNELTKSAYQLLKNTAEINFVGNIESRHILEGVADVAVSDGFTGNAVLKSIEGTAMVMMQQMKSVIMNGGLIAKIGGLLLRTPLKKFAKQLNYENVGGAILLGVKAPVIKAHGNAKSNTLVATFEQLIEFLNTPFIEEIESGIQRMQEASEQSE